MISNTSNRPITLIRLILTRIFIVSLLVIVVAGTRSYSTTYTNEKEGALAELQKYVGERVRTDSEIFQLAEDNLAVFKEEFLKLYNSAIKVSEEEFWSIYHVDELGAVRMNREFFDGLYTPEGDYVYGLSSFIGNNQSVDDPDLKRRLVLAARVLAKLGPAWVNRFANVHVAYPENAISLFYPREAWGLIARADLPMNELGVIRSVNKAANPERKAVWSGLYYDETAEKWTVTYMDPLDVNDRHLITPAHDIFLTDIMERLIEHDSRGIYNFIIREDGYLVAHPSGPTDEQKLVGQLSLDKIEDPFVIESYRLIQQELKSGLADVAILENKSYDTYLAVAWLDGPNWLFVRVFPKAIISKTAHLAARGVVVEAIVIVAIILVIVYYVMKLQAERPLRALALAAEAIGKGEYKAVADQRIPLPVHFPNEIGLLSTRFVEMAISIANAQDNLERVVEERTMALEQANATLMEMSLVDGLTAIHNRRSFDRSIARVFEDAKAELGTFSIMMADIDFFKNYNDTYGHAEGDKVLKLIAQTLRDNIREEDRVFRYGGEEFVVIFSHADIAMATTIAQRLAQSVRALHIKHEGSPYGIITLSGGIQEYHHSLISPNELIKAADGKMYQAKNNGRNKVV